MSIKNQNGHEYSLSNLESMLRREKCNFASTIIHHYEALDRGDKAGANAHLEEGIRCGNRIGKLETLITLEKEWPEMTHPICTVTNEFCGIF